MGCSRKQQTIRIAGHRDGVWGVEGNEIREVGRGQIMQGLVGGSKGFGFYSGHKLEALGCHSVDGRGLVWRSPPGKDVALLVRK